jgi:hypothetical protein
MLILGAMMYLFGQVPVNAPTGMYDIVHNCLDYAKDYSDIQGKLKECIPSSYQFQVKVCAPGSINSKSCEANVPDTTTYLAEYIKTDKIIRVWVY